MSKHKSIDRICVIAIVLSLILTLVFINGEQLGITKTAYAAAYENRLFSTDKVHSIDIVTDDWESFIKTAQSEEYSACTVVIDGEAYKNVGIRGKGNTSLSTVSSMDSDRYSFKIEFDCYDSNKSYYGLDKLCLNNIIQDNTYMKDYLAYRLMNEFGVNAPLCSYAYITVNGEDWGLYLAVEGIEEAFLERNYGSAYGELYKPDSMSFGGGRGNGKDFKPNDLENIPDKENPRAFMNDQSDREFPPNFGNDGSDRKVMGGGMGSDDVKLKYTDDNYSSYSNIFDNAKTEITNSDKDRLIRSLKSLGSYENIEEVVDIDKVIRYFVVHNFVRNGDSYTGSMIHNYYLYEENGRLSMIPWDYNLAFGTFQSGNANSEVNSPIDSPVSGDMSDRPMIGWIFSDEKYTEIYHRYFSEFISSVDITAIIDEAAELISSYVEKDPTKFCTFEEFEKGVDSLRLFCELRLQSVQGQLNGTLPSDSEGQNSDSSALIDTSALNLSDMGTMNMGNFGGRGKENMQQNSFDAEPPSDFPNMGMPNDQNNDSSTQKSPDSGENMPDTGQMQFPQAENNTSPLGYILLGASVVLLVGGLIFAIRFKR